MTARPGVIDVTVPTDPPACGWVFPDPSDFPADDLVAIGADLAPGTLLGAYRRGLFPMPTGEPDSRMLWWSPRERGVLPVRGLKVSRSLARSVRRMEVRVDTAFDEVIAACADPGRPAGWIDERILAAYSRLHRLGWVHSVEAWCGGELAGGLYGVAIGGLFAGESMFYRVRDASKVALVGLVEILSDGHAEERLVDVQWRTDHLSSLGVVGVPREAYLARLSRALELPLPAAFQ
jgi:leucyl/phenylalanyl-tRNA--protein transferase